MRHGGGFSPRLAMAAGPRLPLRVHRLARPWYPASKGSRRSYTDNMPVCVLCTTNPHLKRWIEANGAVGACAICRSEGQHVIEVTRLTSRIDDVIRRHYRPDDEDGEVATTLIARVAGISPGLARLVTNVTHDDEAPGQSFYDYGPLSFAGRLSHEHSDRWAELKEIVKHKARFFEPETRSILDAIRRWGPAGPWLTYG